MEMIPQLVASLGGGFALLAGGCWAFFHIYKAVREDRTAKVTDIESVTRQALESLKMERDRTTELYTRIDTLSNENHVLRGQVSTLQSQVERLERELRQLRG